MTRKIEILNSCNQNWDEMRPEGSGRYCQECSKVVHDFTGYSIQGIPKNASGELCGMFLAEQIEPDLKPIEVSTSLKAAILTVGTLAGLHITEAKAQQVQKKPATEYVDQQHALDADSTEDVIVREDTCVTNAPDGMKPGKPIKRKYYLSRRFPFIFRRATRVMGRYRH